MANKKKSGLDYLKEKYAELEKDVKRLKIDNAEKQGIIERQASTISALTVERDAARLEVVYERQKADTYWRHMGWFRRWLWLYRK